MIRHASPEVLADLSALGDAGQGADGRSSVPSVVVVDPNFDAYPLLAAHAESGLINLHFRSSGADAVRLARRLEIDAWIIASELDDMTGHDLVRKLDDARRTGRGGAAKIAVVESAEPGGRRWSLAEAEAATAGADEMLSYPVSLRDLRALLGFRRPAARRSLTLVDCAMCCVPIAVFLSIMTLI